MQHYSDTWPKQMESAWILNQLPLPQMEPLAQLEPYLCNLNVSEALRSFHRLADSLEDPSVTSLSDYSAANSPNSHYTSSLASPSSSFSSSASCYSSTYGSELDSPLGFNSDQAEKQGSGKGRRRLKGSSKCCKSNATAAAAKRYRNKVSGINSSLRDELTREERRNAKLRDQLETKLTLYKEFLSLLSDKLQVDDFQLAQLGLKSVEKVSRVADAAIEEPNQQTTDLFQDESERFRQIIEKQSGQVEPATEATASESQGEGELIIIDRADEGMASAPSLSSGQLVYDFYLDSFIDPCAD